MKSFNKLIEKSIEDLLQFKIEDFKSLKLLMEKSSFPNMDGNLPELDKLKVIDEEYVKRYINIFGFFKLYTWMNEIKVRHMEYHYKRIDNLQLMSDLEMETEKELNRVFLVMQREMKKSFEDKFDYILNKVNE